MLVIHPGTSKQTLTLGFKVRNIGWRARITDGAIADCRINGPEVYVDNIQDQEAYQEQPMISLSFPGMLLQAFCTLFWDKNITQRSEPACSSVTYLQLPLNLKLHTGDWSEIEENLPLGEGFQCLFIQFRYMYC
jgi:hypothetical protein